MSDAVDRGITVTEIAAMDQPVDLCPETTAAFVGRALRGPLNTPVLVEHFGQFRRRFGDIWTRSSLGPAAQQFFEHGGKRLYVVRVANNARGAMLCLPASGSALVLRAVEVGSTEHIRAAVDYDGIADDDDELFNLTLQRVDPGSGHIIDQEFYKLLSWNEQARTFVGDELLASDMARAEHPYPTHRPEATVATDATYKSTYVGQTQAGTDGTELSNYDLIGSRLKRSGLFALEQIEHFDVLYLPPPGKSTDVGPAAILAAERYCGERRAMLIVDPLREWQTPADATAGISRLGYASPNMLGYFPRASDLDNAQMTRPLGGAIAGLLCKQDRTHGPWQDLDQLGMGLQNRFVPAIDIADSDRKMLYREGLNVVVNGPAGRARLTGSVTMGRGCETDRKFSRLPVRRFCLQIINTIARATRWAVFEPADDSLAKKIRGQILTYLDCLNDLEAFVQNDCVVRCDTGFVTKDNRQDRGITILLLFHPVGCQGPISITLHHTASGCRVTSTAFAPAASSTDA